MKSLICCALLSFFLANLCDAAIVESRVCNGNGCKDCPDASDKCGNGVCDIALGENCDTCSQDCGACILCPSRKCGDGTCDPNNGENGCNCPIDCPGCCQDGLCLKGETFSSCASDCAASIYGKVVDTFTGSPVGGSTVRCGVFKQNLSSIIVTDATGNFVINYVPPGMYECVASLGGSVSAVKSFLVHPGSFRFPNRTETIHLELETGLLAGSTYFTDGPKLLPGVVVVCRNAQSRREVVSDANGNFFLTGMRPGTYTCEGNAPGYSSVSTTVQVTSNTLSRVDVFVDVLRGNIAGAVVNSLSGLNVDSVVTCRTNIETYVGNTTNGNFYFPNVIPAVATCTAVPIGSGWIPNSAVGVVPGGLNLTLNINVTQILSNLTGRVVNNDTGAVIANADVSCSSPALLLVTLAAADGTFSFRNLPAGLYTCVARRGGFAARTVSNINIGTNSLIALGDVGMKGLPGVVQVFLTSTRTNSFIAGNLTCVDVTQVTVFEGPVSQPIVLPAVIPGNLTCTATVPSFAPTVAMKNVAPSVTSDFSVQVFPLVGTITGTVIDSLSSSVVVRGAILTCTSTDLTPQNIYTGTTNSNGLYTISNVILGTYTCRATVPAYTLVTVTVTLSTGGQVVTSSFAMDPIPAKIEGRVFDTISNAPVSGARVSCTFPLTPTAPTLNALTATDGQFFFENIRFYGPWRCAAVVSGYSHANGRGFYPLETVRGTTTSAAVAMQPFPGIALLTVVDGVRTFAPLPAAKVFCRPVNSDQAIRVFLNTDGQGNYSNTRGQFICNATLEPGYSPYQVPPFTLAPGDLKKITIPMPPIPGSLVVVVVDTTPSAISGARVVCGNAPPAFSNAQGQAEVTGLQAGVVRCSVGAAGFREASILATINNGVQGIARVVLQR